MSNFGQSTTATGGRSLPIAVNNDKMRWKAGGLTIDWSTVTAVSSDTTLGDGTVVKSGDKYILAGTILSRISASDKYGPANTAAGDGRETVTAAMRGRCYIVNRNLLLSELHSDHIGEVFDGGAVYRARLQVDGSNQPTTANLLTMMPGITLID